MARYTGPRVRVVRRFGGAEIPGLVAPREIKRPYAPGQHGPTQRVKLSDYAIRLREKQKLRYHYGVGERQFRKYMVTAKHKKGNTGQNLLSLLESRLDNVVFRLGFARTTRAARQMVTHGHICVNGTRVNIPSYQLSIGDVISIHESSSMKEKIAQDVAGPTSLGLPSYLEREDGALKGTFKATPDQTDCPLTINEALVVELYALAL